MKGHPFFSSSSSSSVASSFSRLAQQPLSYLVPLQSLFLFFSVSTQLRVLSDDLLSPILTIFCCPIFPHHFLFCPACFLPSRLATPTTWPIDRPPSFFPRRFPTLPRWSKYSYFSRFCPFFLLSLFFCVRPLPAVPVNILASYFSLLFCFSCFFFLSNLSLFSSVLSTNNQQICVDGPMLVSLIAWRHLLWNKQESEARQYFNSHVYQSFNMIAAITPHCPTAIPPLYPSILFHSFVTRHLLRNFIWNYNISLLTLYSYTYLVPIYILINSYIHFTNFHTFTSSIHHWSLCINAEAIPSPTRNILLTAWSFEIFKRFKLVTSYWGYDII